MSVLIKPIVTEKMTELGEKENQFGFIVEKQANKIEIKIAIQELYDVSVVNINTMRCGGKAKSRSSRTGVIQGKSGAYKKAFVTLAEGDKIDFYSNI